jgi:hypothetical protein
MPLAGSIKLRSFLAVIVGIGIGGVVWLVTQCRKDEAPAKPPEVKIHEPKEPPPPTPTPTPTPASDKLAMRAWDDQVLSYHGESISGDKIKDASKGKPYKINVYKDAGHKTVNRVKVDINRNDKFDEKITFDGSKITLEIAPADDENYTKTYHWSGTAWVRDGAEPDGARIQPTKPGTTSHEEPRVPAGKSDLPARAYDSEVIAWKDKSISGDKIKDATKGKSYKINVYMDAGKTTVNRAKVDINRNDKFDEKYTFEPGKITLQRAPADDEQYTETYHWTGDGWAKQ